MDYPHVHFTDTFGIRRLYYMLKAHSTTNNKASCQLVRLTLQGVSEGGLLIIDLVCFRILESMLLKIFPKSIHALVIVER